ncbi:oligosaccharyltransferase complex subunit epsilon [Ascosphaera acerosa]|nr:oligosaccharyltransferase complex subunit epsilon [Ascosphaera acerosa]
MAAKKRAAASAATSSSAATTTTTTNSPDTTTTDAAAAAAASSPAQPPTRLASADPKAAGAGALHIACAVWRRYTAETAQRVLLLDAFLLFLIVVGALQFVYCVLVGNYPFNAFLAGFGAAVGQFVLAVSLRMQISAPPPPAGRQEEKQAATTPSTSSSVPDDDAPAVSHERAFADFVFGSVILHFFCINFLN